MDPLLSDALNDLASLNGRKLNPTLIDLLTIGLTVVQEQHGGNLGEAVASHQQSPASPANRARAKAARA
jgi:ABC-type microcin C transport system permease subunit YejB